MATKLRDRGNLSAEQQAKIRLMLAEGKSPDAIATEMHYLPKYLAGRIAAHHLDKPAVAMPTATPTPKARAKFKAFLRKTSAKESETVESILGSVPPGLRADLARLVVQRLKEDFKIEIKPEKADAAMLIYYEIVGRLEELRHL